VFRAPHVPFNENQCQSMKIDKNQWQSIITPAWTIDCSIIDYQYQSTNWHRLSSIIDFFDWLRPVPFPLVFLWVRKKSSYGRRGATVGQWKQPRVSRETNRIKLKSIKLKLVSTCTTHNCYLPNLTSVYKRLISCYLSCNHVFLFTTSFCLTF